MLLHDVKFHIFVEGVNKPHKTFFLFLQLDMVQIQLEKSPPTFGKVREVKQNKLRWRFKKYKSTFEATFSLISASSHLKVAFVCPTL